MPKPNPKNKYRSATDVDQLINRMSSRNNVAFKDIDQKFSILFQNNAFIWNLLKTLDLITIDPDTKEVRMSESLIQQIEIKKLEKEKTSTLKEFGKEIEMAKIQEGVMKRANGRDKIPITEEEIKKLKKLGMYSNEGL